MTDDKLAKVRAEIERTMNWEKEQAAHSYGNVRLLHECREDMCKKFLSFIDYTQEKSINNGLDLGCGVIWKDVEPVSEEQVKESPISKHDDKTCKENGDSLTQEPVNNGFEAEVKKLWEEINTGHSYSIVDSYNIFYGLCMDIADWQKQKDESKVLTEEQCRKIRDDAFELGKDAMKQQMMKGAYEREIKVDAGGYSYIPQMELYDYDKDIPLAKEGEKVKVIVIKED